MTLASSTAYREGLDAYVTTVADLFSDYRNEDPTSSRLRSARLEHQFECLRDWSQLHTLSDIRKWFLEMRERCAMRVQEIPLNECRQWSIDEQTGNVTHSSGEFFTVHGLRVSMTADREVGEKGWDQPILTQVGFDGGLLGLLRKRFDGVPHYLTEAKAEPGNYGKLQISPTLQATFSNLKRAHAGSKPRFASYFETPEAMQGSVLYESWLSEDGGRLHLKRNRAMLVEIPPESGVEIPEGFRWMSMYQIKALLFENAWISPHIRGIISHL